MSGDVNFKQLQFESPDFLDLPWNEPLADWHHLSPRTVDVTRGLSRHQVVFVSFAAKIYAVKSMSFNDAEKEFNLLASLEQLRLPAVKPVGYGQKTGSIETDGFLITHYLDMSIPYRNLFMPDSITDYGDHLLDGVAGLLVQLHLSGIYWGDCSLSNTLFRRDAGALQPYLVDIETGEYFPEQFSPEKRLYDLEIMDENITGELYDLGVEGLLAEDIPVADTGKYIRLRYQQLWEEITREDIIDPGEYYRIQDRIRALNDLGYSVGDVELAKTRHGDQLRLRVVVTDRNYHRDQLLSLTGLNAEEGQARKMLNEIQEIKATLSRENNRSTPLSVAAHYWHHEVYLVTVNMLKDRIANELSTQEVYCQILEHKWYLSEQAGKDVGHNAAASDFITKHL